MEWQPIETAPIEKPVDLWVIDKDGDGCRICGAVFKGNSWVTGFDDEYGTHYLDYTTFPTHWMPLPPAPKNNTQ